MDRKFLSFSPPKYEFNAETKNRRFFTRDQNRGEIIERTNGATQSSEREAWGASVLSPGGCACRAATFVAAIDRIGLARQVAQHQRRGEPRTFEPERLEQRGIEREGVRQPLLPGEGVEKLPCDTALTRDAIGAAQGHRFDVTPPGISCRSAASPPFRAERASPPELTAVWALPSPNAHTAHGLHVDGRVIHVGEYRDARIANVFVASGRSGQRQQPAVGQPDVGRGLRAAG